MFTSSKREEVAAVYWRDEGQTEFKLRPVLIDPLENDVEANEGDPRLVIHTRRERSRVLRQKKIADVLKEKGNINCEACDFSFEEPIWRYRSRLLRSASSRWPRRDGKDDDKVRGSRDLVLKLPSHDS